MPIKGADHLMPEEEMMTVQIHDATPNDADGVRHVQQSTWLATYPNAELGITKEDIEARFHASSEEAIKRRQTQHQRINSDPLVHLWVAKEAERIVGFCLAKKEGPQNRIQAIYVLPEYQGTGIGKRLLQTASDWLGSQQEIVLNVASYNHQAITFYKKFGFVPSGRLAHSGITKLPSGVVIPEIEMIKRDSHRLDTSVLL
jgi:ribosomal protein S18 acetylase RimI-like enzyme